IFELIGKRASAKTCEAIKGIITEGDEIASEYKGSEAIDAGLLATAQAVEHYEIARYGTLRTWARDLGVDEAVELLEQTLDEEKETDQLLTKLADATINESAQAQAE
ncbi:MAG: ferritin-like domain-containing protein, partial [Hyphomicrobiales bacterium]|nr:ferritin-like domain-containing protein [Hyphomicrobiales bacterium]MBV9592104.1 ferritin-like domain-containing protein [Hyphomicrobiales bacterium]